MVIAGVDLTDPYAARPRPADVALLEGGVCQFAHWPVRADLYVLDGPLALAAAGTMRECERRLACAGKTPASLPEPRTKPYAGFIRGSVELAHRLAAEGCTMFEAYPGAAWTALAGKRLPKKTTREGFLARRRLLPLRFATEPATHDHLDAALCAWLGSEALQGRVEKIGAPLYWRDGFMREGFIIQPARTYTRAPARARA